MIGCDRKSLEKTKLMFDVSVTDRWVGSEFRVGRYAPSDRRVPSPPLRQSKTVNGEYVCVDLIHASVPKASVGVDVWLEGWSE